MGKRAPHRQNPGYAYDIVDVDADAGVKMTSRINNTSQLHLKTNRTSNIHRPHPSSRSTSMSPPAAAPVATMPLIPFPGTFPGGFCGLSPAQLAPLQMYPPYIFMGFPLHPQLLQSYPIPTADLPATHPQTNPAKRKSTQPMSSPRDEKLHRQSDMTASGAAVHSVGHVTYLPIVTSPPRHDEPRDRKHSVMTSSGGSGSADSRQFDQDGALDLTKK